MSIFRNTFTPEVRNQLNKRQKALQKRSANDIIYLNSRNSWIRMTSAVNVDGNNDLAKAMIVIEIENYMYHANFRIDKEINCMALISRLIELAKPQLIK